jgi:hypothetical protein
MKKMFSIFSLLVIALSACGPPSTQGPTLSVNQQAATVVSLTLTAIAQGGKLPLASPTAGATKTPLASPTASGDAPTIQPNVTPTALTGTLGATILTVDSNTNCREGPGLNYVVVIVLVPGTTYQMIARTADNKYWVVAEIGKSNTCWVLAEMSNAFGNVNLLPVTTPSAPTSAAGALQAPTGLGWAHTCAFNGASYDITVVLRWADRSNNETGFRVYRDNALVEELPANTTTYTDVFAGGAAQVNTYRVSAWNANGEALGSSISFSCP